MSIPSVSSKKDSEDSGFGKKLRETRMHNKIILRQAACCLGLSNILLSLVEQGRVVVSEEEERRLLFGIYVIARTRDFIGKEKAINLVVQQDW